MQQKSCVFVIEDAEVAAVITPIKPVGATQIRDLSIRMLIDENAHLR